MNKPVDADVSELSHQTLNDAADVHLSDMTVAERQIAQQVEDFPKHIGRYQIERLLGKGSFGMVYLAHDETLDRSVAIKVPHPHLVTNADQAEEYLTEARTVANLDHPNIVPVYDVGSSEKCPFFVVSKYIDGVDLAKRLKRSRLSLEKAVNLVTKVAEALHHAHKQRLVHRDIKPGNLLLDEKSEPFVVDFGLALREQDVGKGPRFAGTPAYMSPEQARSEGHRVDGRSDIFSLGIVLYELLTGIHPFRAETRQQLLQLITEYEPRPLRQIDDQISIELERICMKALSKRVTDRYATAKDLASDLRLVLAELGGEKAIGATSTSIELTPEQLAKLIEEARTSNPSIGLGSHNSQNQTVMIVPKGLRSFDAQDASFFLELLPGPRDRDGLSSNLRFWKTQIEEKDPDNTFSVGLIYGPSGCGKSSLVKAGLFPVLSSNIIAIYLEATAGETETRIVNGLRKRLPDLPGNLSLNETLADIRRGQGIPLGKKVVIFLDQFEQWLHAKKNDPKTELVQALRQCDGSRLQCVVMVRDDFWMAVTRFLTDLEVELVQGRNFAAADLFDVDHARKVLAAFGRAYGKLPESNRDFSPEQRDFLKQVVDGLTEDGKVICVRLALFAEMMKGKPWTLDTLKEVGGTQGVGVAFLDETFSSPSSNPTHRLYQKGAQAVLTSLLPDTGTNIKGHMRSSAELAETAGYAISSPQFASLIRILDSEIRLITPTDPEGIDEQEKEKKKNESNEISTSSLRYYQLTHDYLVPSLREWLTRKQKETRRGRTSLLLEDRASVWSKRPENRQLPSFLQWISIRWFTDKSTWTSAQKKMMSSARKYYAWRGITAGLLLAGLAFAGMKVQETIAEQQLRIEAEGLAQSLVNGGIEKVQDFIDKLAPHRKRVEKLLRESFENAPENSEAKLNASLALLPDDPRQVDYLYSRLLDAKPNEVDVIRNALLPYKDQFLDRLWNVAKGPEKNKEGQRLRAASMLAEADPESLNWEQIQAALAKDLVNVSADQLGTWMHSFNPVKSKFFGPLSEVYRNPNRGDFERYYAAVVLADYIADKPVELADLLMDADERQFATIFAKFEKHLEKAGAALDAEINRILPPETDDPIKEKLAKRQATAAVALLRLGYPDKVWQLLKYNPEYHPENDPDAQDPRVRSYLIHRFSPLGADLRLIEKQLDEDLDLSIKRALLLSLGEFNQQQFSAEELETLFAKLKLQYETNADPGMREAARWLLRKWGQEKWLEDVDAKWTPESKVRSDKLREIKKVLERDKGHAPPQWYVTSHGQTMVVIPGPVKFWMGSPEAEAHHQPEELQHIKQIPRSFAIASTAVTVEQFRKFEPDFDLPVGFDWTGNLPVVGINWRQSAKYCNFLSKEEGLPPNEWCYEIDGQEVHLKPSYLRKSGYRLPTESEMEFATRAGATTARFFGETEELLPKYAWFNKNSSETTHPVGLLKPNDLGIFDAHGNTWTWCQGTLISYSSGNSVAVDLEIEDDLIVETTVNRVLRGGSFFNHQSQVRSAFRDTQLPRLRSNVNGFRLARTITQSP